MADSFYQVLSAAVADVTEHGFDTAGRLEYWTQRLREAALVALTPRPRMEHMLRQALGSIYKRLIDRGGIFHRHPGIDRFTLQRVRPALHAELERRIMASASLIKLNQTESVNKTLSRFQGWGTSVPAGGSDAVDRAAIMASAKKAMGSLPFEERRVIIDQGHKLNASLNDILATDGGAIAMVWRSKWRQAGYHYRHDHKERDGHVYAIRGSWAHSKGLIKAGPSGFSDAITAPAEEIFCRCEAEYLYNLRDLPKDMLTAKGDEALKDARAKIRAM